MRGAKVVASAILIIGSLAVSRADALISDTSGSATQTPAGNDVARLLSLHNQTRSEHGLPSLAESAMLVSLARERAGEMASAHAIWHDYGIGRRLPPGRIVGENVGRSPSVDDVFAAFMDSPTHRANILRASYSLIGVAVVAGDDGYLYVEVLYLTPGPDGRSPEASPSASARASHPEPARAEQAVTVLLELVHMDAG